MNPPDRAPITGIPGRTVTLPVWLLLVAGLSLAVLAGGAGAIAGVLLWPVFSGTQ
jgi:hypothetical protein